MTHANPLLGRLAWATDIHLDDASDAARRRFVDEILAANPSALLISGDIGAAATVAGHLEFLAAAIQRPLYFVLGNHDFYGASIGGIRERFAAGTALGAQFLTTGDVVEIDARTALIGHDGWYDGRYGTGNATNARWPDFAQIDDFAGMDRLAVFRRCRDLGDAAAGRLRTGLLSAGNRHRNVLVMTHYPPFEQACFYQGAPTEPDYLPFYACKAIGEMLLAFARERPKTQIAVLCGHTHTAADVRILPNLRVVVGAAEIGRPALQPPMDYLAKG